MLSDILSQALPSDSVKGIGLPTSVLQLPLHKLSIVLSGLGNPEAASVPRLLGWLSGACQKEHTPLIPFIMWRFLNVLSP